MSSKREHPEQVPTEYNKENTLKALRDQEHVAGEKRDKTVTDFPKAAAVGQLLKDLEFPADKTHIVRFLEHSTKPEAREILQAVKNIEEKEYQNVSDVTEAAGLVSK
jgi:uncharacterized protein DUF2795